MKKQTNPAVISIEVIQNKIYLIRGQKVMLDSDLADLYRVETRVLVQGVKRNQRRFPLDFMFQLTEQEHDCLRSQIVISNKERGGRRYIPFVFTEQGVAMLSSILNSQRAIDVNIQIMRVFTRLRQTIESNKELRYKVEELEKKYDGQFKAVFSAIRQLMTYPDDDYKRNKVGFKVG